MQALAYYLALSLVKFFQGLPLKVVAAIGRCGGSVAYWIDARHRGVAMANLARCFGGERSRAELCALAREHFRRLGENYCCALKTAGMDETELRSCLEVVGANKLVASANVARPRSRMLAVGHFGNFELFAHLGAFLPGYRLVTTYRALRQPRLNALVLSLRQRSGCVLFERRTEVAALRRALREPHTLGGVLADQRAGSRGVRGPFLGHETSTSIAPALLAQRYQMPLHTAICFRTASGRWRIEIGDEVPTFENGARRSPEAVMRDVNAAFEAAVLRDPANWFWVHNRWKSANAERPTASASKPVVQQSLAR